MDNRTCYSLVGTLREIGRLTPIKRKRKVTLYKRLLTIETFDGQLLFPEMRNAKLRLLDREAIGEGDKVAITYIFEGSQKNGKKYNNIYLNSIEKL